jgi:hypothetical protein
MVEDFEYDIIDHPLLYYLLIVLAGISVLDIVTTSVALSNPYNMEGNPLMAPLLPYAPYVKFVYIMGIFVISDYLEHRGKNQGVLLLCVACLVSFAIVTNNILILNGFYLFH